MPLILIVIKASLLLSAALLGARFLRAAPAAARHALWSVTFAALLALPWLDAAMPIMRVPVPSAWMTGTGGTGAAGTLRSEVLPDAPAAAPIVPSSRGVSSRHEIQAPSGMAASATGQSAMPSIAAVVRLVWLGGAAAAAGALLLSLLRVRRLTGAATDVADPAWREGADRLAARLGLRRPPRVLTSGAVRTPMAGGVWRPVIFLPADASSWSAERRDVVLAHELSHLAGRDPVRHVAARLAVACYWFHPLAWMAARQSTLAREQACDEAVLALGVRPSAYARVLLDLAETMATPARAAAVLPMVERSLLEARVMAILDHDTTSSRLRHRFVPAAAAALLALTLAAAQPAARDIDVRSPTPVASIARTAAHATTAPASAVPPSAAPSSAVPSSANPSAPQTRRDGSCWLSGSDRDDFNGYTDTDQRGMILERVGMSGGALIIQQRFGDMRLCIRAEGGSKDGRDTPTIWAGRASRVIIESDRGGSTAHLDVTRQAGSPAQTAWRVNGADRPFDATAQAWRDAVLAVLDQSWEVSALRGEESSLRGEISTIRGEESTLRGEISTIRGEISTLRGQQSTIHGEESMLQGEISSIRGHVSSLRGQISAERGAISALEASRYGLSSADRDRLTAERKAHEDEIARLEGELRAFDEASQVAAVERQIRALDSSRKVAAIEEQIRKFNEDGKTAAIEKQIEALNVSGKIAELERRIQGLDVERRTRQLESRRDEAVRRLQQALAAIK